jgi:type II secretory pathway pseudopilin PulG
MSMFELLIVIAIIGAVSAVALPQLVEARDEYRLTAVAGQVVGAMNNARILSVSRNIDFRVNVSDTDTYLVQGDVSGTWTTENSYDLPTGYSFGTSGSINEFHSRGNATPVVTLTITNLNGTTRDVVVEVSGRSYSQ